MADTKEKSVVPVIGIIGDCFVDIVAPGMSGLPRWNTDIVIPAITMHVGGSATNTAYNLSGGFASGTSCRVVVPIGDDEFGAYITRQLTAVGLGHSVACLPVMAGTATGVCICMSGATDRCFVDCHGANAKLTAAHVFTGATPAAAKALSECTHIHTGGFFNCHGLHTGFFATFLSELNERGVTVSLDPQFDTTEQWTGQNHIIPHILSCVDILLPSETEACGLSGVGKGQVIDALRGLRTKIRPGGWVIIKCGSDGCVAMRAPLKRSRSASTAAPPSTDDKTTTAPPAAAATTAAATDSNSATTTPSLRGTGPDTIYRCTAFGVTVVDTTGGGDSFDAGFLYQFVLRGSTIEHALRFACASGALRVARVSASSNPPTLSEIDALMMAQAAADAKTTIHIAPTALTASGAAAPPALAGGVVSILPPGTNFVTADAAVSAASAVSALAPPASGNSAPSTPTGGSAVSTTARIQAGLSSIADFILKPKAATPVLASTSAPPPPPPLPVANAIAAPAPNSKSAAPAAQAPVSATATATAPATAAVVSTTNSAAASAPAAAPASVPVSQRAATTVRSFTRAVADTFHETIDTLNAALDDAAVGSDSDDDSARRTKPKPPASAAAAAAGGASKSDTLSLREFTGAAATATAAPTVQRRVAVPVIETDLNSFLNGSGSSSSASSPTSADATNRTNASPVPAAKPNSAAAAASSGGTGSIAETVAAAKRKSGKPHPSGRPVTPGSPAAVGWASLTDGSLG